MTTRQVVQHAGEISLGVEIVEFCGLDESHSENFIAHMRARELQAEYFVDELAAIADDGRNVFERSRSSRSTATNSSPFSEVGVCLLYPSPTKLNRKIAHKNAPLLDNRLRIANQIYVFCLTRTKTYNHVRAQDAHSARH
jgi:hypothetical protein